MQERRNAWRGIDFPPCSRTHLNGMLEVLNQMESCFEFGNAISELAI